MAKNLGGAIIGLLDSDRVELRTAAARVLGAVGKGDRAVVAALAARLGDSDAEVRRIALDALAGMTGSRIAPQLVAVLRGGDEALAARALELLARHAGDAEATLCKEVGAGPIAARRAMVQLLVRRATRPALAAVIDQLGDEELGDQALQLLRAELDRPEPGAGKLAATIARSAIARTREVGKALARAWAAAQRGGRAGQAARTGKRGKPGSAGKPARGSKSAAASKSAGAREAGGAEGRDPLLDPGVARAIAALTSLLRLIGDAGRPEAQPLLLQYAGDDQPRPIRLAAIAGLRRTVANGDAKGGARVIEALIELAETDDATIAEAAIDTLRGARIPDALAKRFAALARSSHPAAQKLAMERLPAGGGAAAIQALVDALGGGDPTARDAASRGLARAPEAALPLIRALLATGDEHLARRYAGALRSHRGHVAPPAIDELVEHVRQDMDRQAGGKATADQIALGRVVTELLDDLAPARHVELLFDRARRLRKAGKSLEAFGSLKPLLRSRADIDTAIDDEQRFLLAVLALEVAGEGLLRTARTDDPVFEQFARLAAKGFPVALRLTREPDVSDEAIYALGFRLLESADGAHEELGAELMQGIIDERPRSKLAKAARNKLKLTGHVDED